MGVIMGRLLAIARIPRRNRESLRTTFSPTQDRRRRSRGTDAACACPAPTMFGIFWNSRPEIVYHRHGVSQEPSRFLEGSSMRNGITAVTLLVLLGSGSVALPSPQQKKPKPPL